MLTVQKQFSLLAKKERDDIIAMISRAQQEQQSRTDIETILNSTKEKIQALSIAAGDDRTGVVRLAAETLDAANDIVQMYIEDPRSYAYAACILKYFNLKHFAIGTLSRVGLDYINQQLPSIRLETLEYFLQHVSMPQFMICLVAYCCVDAVRQARKNVNLNMLAIEEDQTHKINDFLQKVQNQVARSLNNPDALQRTLRKLQKTYQNGRMLLTARRSIDVANYLTVICMLKDHLIRRANVILADMRSEKSGYEIAADWVKYFVSGEVAMDAVMPILNTGVPFVILAASIQSNIILWTPPNCRMALRLALGGLTFWVLTQFTQLTPMGQVFDMTKVGKDTKTIIGLVVNLPNFMAERYVEGEEDVQPKRSKKLSRREQRDVSRRRSRRRWKMLYTSTAISYLSYIVAFSHRLNGSEVVFGVMLLIALRNFPCVITSGIESLAGAMIENGETPWSMENVRRSRDQIDGPVIEELPSDEETDESDLTERLTYDLRRAYGRENVKRACHLLMNHEATKNASWLCHAHVQHMYKVI